MFIFDVEYILDLTHNFGEKLKFSNGLKRNVKLQNTCLNAEF